MQTVFLETSFQIERILAEPTRFEQVEEQLGLPDAQAVTTSYVWMEFQRTVIDDYAHIFRVSTNIMAGAQQFPIYLMVHALFDHAPPSAVRR